MPLTSPAVYTSATPPTGTSRKTSQLDFPSQQSASQPQSVGVHAPAGSTERPQHWQRPARSPQQNRRRSGPTHDNQASRQEALQIRLTSVSPRIGHTLEKEDDAQAGYHEIGHEERYCDIRPNGGAREKCYDSPDGHDAHCSPRKPSPEVLPALRAQRSKRGHGGGIIEEDPPSRLSSSHRSSTGSAGSFRPPLRFSATPQ